MGCASCRCAYYGPRAWHERSMHASPCLGVRPEPLALVSGARLPPIVERLCGLGQLAWRAVWSQCCETVRRTCAQLTPPHTSSAVPAQGPRSALTHALHHADQQHGSSAGGVGIGAGVPTSRQLLQRSDQVPVGRARSIELGTYRSNLGSRKHTGKMCPAAHGLTIQQRQLPVHSPALLALAVERRQQLVLQESGASRIQLRAQPAAQLGAAAQRLPQAPGRGTVERSTGLGRPVSIALNGGPHATGTLVSACKHGLLPLPSAFHCKLCRRGMQPLLPAFCLPSSPARTHLRVKRSMPHTLRTSTSPAARPCGGKRRIAVASQGWCVSDRGCKPGPVDREHRQSTRQRMVRRLVCKHPSQSSGPTLPAHHAHLWQLS